MSGRCLLSGEVLNTRALWKNLLLECRHPLERCSDIDYSVKHIFAPHLMADIHIRESATTSRPRTKPPPKAHHVHVPYAYNPSDDGTDENLLILLHGLGDTEVPFTRLGRQLKLPQTATLALRAPEQVPFLYEQAYQWYPSFDPLGEVLASPNPTPALELLGKVLEHLVHDSAWPPHRIHLFGFAQGGSVVAELGLKWWKDELQKQKESSSEPRPLGSIVSVSGPLLSYPTPSTVCPTPLLVFHRLPPAEMAFSTGDIAAFSKGYGKFVEVKMRGADGMPRSREEWEPIMRFWSERLGKRQTDGLYEVMSGSTV
ncbi:hypothetical protein B0H21DRAFT_302068 [Amylocystis lapponica]|nr:hypothetical protein B0H21DRAFT_302068 [Amylocystis lapponica]